MFFEAFILIISLLALWWSAEILVNNASKLAVNLAIPPALIGINVGLITSFPELTVSLFAVNNAASDVVIGNIVGSNIANIALIIGICATMAPVVFTRSYVKLSFFLVFLSFLVFALSRLGYSLDRFDGLIFLTLFLGFLLYFYLSFKKEKINEQERKKGTFKYAILALVGTAILILSAKYVISSVIVIATSLGVSIFFISLTIVAVGTSLPELITSVIALKNGHSDICIGSVMGSNIYNIIFVLGISAVIDKLPIQASYLNKEMIWMVFFAIICSLFFLINYRKLVLTRFYGVIFLILYGLFIYSIALSAV